MNLYALDEEYIETRESLRSSLVDLGVGSGEIQDKDHTLKSFSKSLNESQEEINTKKIGLKEQKTQLKSEYNSFIRSVSVTNKKIEQNENNLKETLVTLQEKEENLDRKRRQLALEFAELQENLFALNQSFKSFKFDSIIDTSQLDQSKKMVRTINDKIDHSFMKITQIEETTQQFGHTLVEFDAKMIQKRTEKVVQMTNSMNISQKINIKKNMHFNRVEEILKMIQTAQNETENIYKCNDEMNKEIININNHILLINQQLEQIKNEHNHVKIVRQRAIDQGLNLKSKLALTIDDYREKANETKILKRNNAVKLSMLKKATSKCQEEKTTIKNEYIEEKARQQRLIDEHSIISIEHEKVVKEIKGEKQRTKNLDETEFKLAAYERKILEEEKNQEIVFEKTKAELKKVLNRTLKAQKINNTLNQSNEDSEILIDNPVKMPRYVSLQNEIQETKQENISIKDRINSLEMKLKLGEQEIIRSKTLKKEAKIEIKNLNEERSINQSQNEAQNKSNLAKILLQINKLEAKIAMKKAFNNYKSFSSMMFKDNLSHVSNERCISSYSDDVVIMRDQNIIEYLRRLELNRQNQSGTEEFIRHLEDLYHSIKYVLKTSEFKEHIEGNNLQDWFKIIENEPNLRAVG